MVSDATRLAGALQGLGVGPGDIVAVQLPNWYEGAVAQTAVTLCGAVLLPIILSYGTRELGFILRRSGARVLVVPGGRRGRDHAAMIASLGELPGLRVVVVDEQAAEGMIPFGDLTDHPYLRPVVRPSDRALLVFTSGTTADPKGVQHGSVPAISAASTPTAI